MFFQEELASFLSHFPVIQKTKKSKISPRCEPWSQYCLQQINKFMSGQKCFPYFDPCITKKQVSMGHDLDVSFLVKIFIWKRLRLANFKNYQMLLVNIFSKFILNFQSNFSKRQEGPLFNRRFVHFLAFKRLVNRSFYQKIFLFREVMG